MSAWYPALRTRLADAGLRPRELTLAGGKLLVTERGARVMAVMGKGLDTNPFWTPVTIGEMPAGGDRLWIAPEVAFFWPNLEKAREDPVKWSRVPEAIDPGQYAVARAGEREVQFEAEMELTDVRVGKTIRLHVSRGVYAIEPLADMPSQVNVVSYGTRHVVAAIGGDVGALGGTWSLLQLPAAGTLIFPTTRDLSVADDVRSYYDPFGDRHVQVGRRCVRFLIDGQRRIKMGILAEWTTGRMGYYRQMDAGRAVLVLRVFGPQPGQVYPDMPRSADAKARRGGDCVQAYNDDGGPASFGEMEHHDPAVVVGDGPTHQSASFVTHIFSGPEAAVCDAGERLLGVAIDAIA